MIKLSLFFQKFIKLGLREDFLFLKLNLDWFLQDLFWTGLCQNAWESHITIKNLFFFWIWMFWDNISQLLGFYEQKTFEFFVFFLLQTLIKEISNWVRCTEISSFQISSEYSALCKFISKWTNFIYAQIWHKILDFKDFIHNLRLCWLYRKCLFEIFKEFTPPIFFVIFHQCRKKLKKGLPYKEPFKLWVLNFNCFEHICVLRVFQILVDFVRIKILKFLEPFKKLFVKFLRQRR